MTRAPRPIEALDAHVATVRALKGPNGGFIFANAGQTNRTGLIAAASHSLATFQKSSELVGNALDSAATVVVTDRMLDLVLKRMKQVEFGQAIEYSDLPFPSAFIVLPRLVWIGADWKDPVAYNEKGEFDSFPFRNYACLDGLFWVYDPDIATGSRADVAEALRNMTTITGEGILYGALLSQGSMQAWADHAAADGADEDEQEKFARGIHVTKQLGLPHLPTYMAGWGFGLPWDPAYRDEDFVLTKAGEFERRFMIALFRTLNEEVVAPVRIPRAAGRRAYRTFGQIPEVSVLDLRRLHHRDDREEPLDDGSVVMWTHRWPVRPHTRTLYAGTPQERKVPVRGYEKGPAHLPLIVKDRVYRLSR